MNTQRTKIIDRLKKMMRLAEDQAGLPEGVLAAQKAHALMVEHAIQMVDLRDVEKEDIDTLELSIGHKAWKRSLLNILAKYCNCQMYYMTGTPLGCVVGFEAEAVVAKYLYEVVSKEIERHSKAYVKRFCASRPHIGRGDKVRLGNDFKATAVEGVRQKIAEIKKKTEQSHEVGTSLMVNRKQEVDRWVSANLKLHSRTCQSRSSYSEAGFRCGQNISLSSSDKLTGG